MAPDVGACLVALGEGLAELDRAAQVALLVYDPRREMLRERLMPAGGKVDRVSIETTFDHLPGSVRVPISRGGTFVDLTEQTLEWARLFRLAPMAEEGLLSLRGVISEGTLAGVLVVYEPKKFFGSRATERFAPQVALFELAFARFSERDAREEAVRTLEDVTQRVHAEYLRKLEGLERELFETKEHALRDLQEGGDPQRVLALEQHVATLQEEARRAKRRADALDQQVAAAVGQLEQAHIELHRRGQSLQSRTRTLYLIDRVLSLDAATHDPRQLVDGLLALVGTDMQAQRCSLMLRAPEPDMLYLAAARGLAPNVTEGYRSPIGQGVAGRVAAAREPILVQDVAEAREHPLLQDEYFTTGSFISFPLVYHDELLGVVNLTNRAQEGVFLEEDIERVRLLALVISLVTWRARLPERLIETIGVS